jgi:hypothetical protein
MAYTLRTAAISFISSYPYRSVPYSDLVLFLRTEVMLMNSDGTSLQQITHFNVPGFPESQKNATVAAVAGFIGDGSQIFATAMGPSFTKTNWIINFEGRCGNQTEN